MPERLSFSDGSRVLLFWWHVRLRRISIRHFRNLGVQDLELPSEGLALIGNNAQGKSNLLEAIYYLETFRSFRGARDDQVLGFGEPVFRVAGTVSPDGGVGPSVEVSAAFERRGKRKKVTVNGVEPPRIGDALGQMAAVVFSPTDVELVSGGPSGRRRFLDIVLSLTQPGYLESLQEYRQALARRNAALKAGHPGAAVAAWNRGLIRAGTTVILARKQWVHRRCGAFAEYYSAVSGGPEADMVYRSDVRLGPSLTPEEVAEAYREGLMDSAESERRRGVTLVGPHRDELSLRLRGQGGDVDLRDYGSGGQRRTAALALRLVEARTVREVRGREPLILLDNVFAELDPGRSERVMGLMEREETGQVVLTAPKESEIRIRRDALPRWRIEGGRISA